MLIVSISSFILCSAALTALTQLTACAPTCQCQTNKLQNMIANFSFLGECHNIITNNDKKM